MKYLLCAIDLFSKWDAPLKDQKGITIVNAFQKIISRVRKPNKIWVDQGGEFYNKLFKRFLKLNNIEMYSTYNKGKSIDAETFIRALKNKIFKYMTAVSKYVYSDMLDDVVNRYNNAVHSSVFLMMNAIKILMKPSPNSKLVMMLGFQNTKKFFPRDTRKICQKKFLLLLKLKYSFVDMRD